MLNGSNFSAYGERLISLKIHFNCYPGRFIACNMPDRICKKGPEINGISGVITKKTLLCRDIPFSYGFGLLYYRTVQILLP